MLAPNCLPPWVWAFTKLGWFRVDQSLSRTDKQPDYNLVCLLAVPWRKLQQHTPICRILYSFPYTEIKQTSQPSSKAVPVPLFTDDDTDTQQWEWLTNHDCSFRVWPRWELPEVRWGQLPCSFSCFETPLPWIHTPFPALFSCAWAALPSALSLSPTLALKSSSPSSGSPPDFLPLLWASPVLESVLWCCMCFLSSTPTAETHYF